MGTAKIRVEKIIIPTYPNPDKEEMPIFAENRNHQRTSGDIYPNKILNHIQRKERVDKPYKAVILENDYIEAIILPEIGGRVFAARDKSTNYDFFYRQHVIKPALIGALGAWISGGIEFNWPYHHKASGFLKCDCKTEECEDGSVICWVSEHDPVDRMQDTVGIVLRPDATYLETRVRLCNRTPVKHSFLWWENAAVSVNKNYQLFFPHDVTYVNFHYLDSRTSWPISGGTVYNGIDQRKSVDISMHKNTWEATSYFACASDFDFFGGYDHGVGCGVVHIGDHHLSPGKKMFSWGYSQLSRVWERALTDEDGQYCELMAGSYTDNQPNFSWIDAYETKELSQFWYPISRIGTPDFATIHGALRLEKDRILIEATENPGKCRISAKVAGEEVFSSDCELKANQPVSIPWARPDAFVSVSISSADGTELLCYEEKKWDELKKPPVKDSLPFASDTLSAEELYLAGVHVDQYRDNLIKPDAYWNEAINRNPYHVPSLLGLARYHYNCCSYEKAEYFAKRALKILTKFNERLESGEPYYLYALILEALDQYKEAYDYFYKAAWSNDCVVKAMVQISCLDLKSGNIREAIRHARWGLEKDTTNSLLRIILMIAEPEHANDIATDIFSHDPLNVLARYLAQPETFYENLECEPSQQCLDAAYDLCSMGQFKKVASLLKGLIYKRPDQSTCMVNLTIAWINSLIGEETKSYLAAGSSAPIGDMYPMRREEIIVLDYAIENGVNRALLLKGCLLYNKRHYAEACELWEAYIQKEPSDYIGWRCAAIALFSHLNDPDKAYEYMKRSLDLKPDSDQLMFEMAALMDKIGISPDEKIRTLLTNPLDLDNLNTELAKAYNQKGDPDNALAVIKNHRFIPCEGGETAIAEQWFFAQYQIAEKLMAERHFEEAYQAFLHGTEIPDEIGAGIWNRCRKVPFQFKAAECLLLSGKKEEAEEIFRYIIDIPVETFSNMHLPELPYYQARSYDYLDMKEHARNLMNDFKRKWTEQLGKKDNGFFSNTPFLISFIDDPARMRRAYYKYLLGLVDLWDGRKESAKKKLSEAYDLNTDNIYARIFSDEI